MTDPLSLQQALNLSQRHLETYSQTARQDAQVLLAHILGKNRAWVLAHPEHILTPQQKPDFQTALEKLTQAIPLPYILGEWEFFGRKFHVNSKVLIPRPETEHLIETALQWLKKHPARHKAIDIGTGSGCIAVTLAVEVDDLDLQAVDISTDALAMAQTNAARHAVNIIFKQSNLLNNVEGQFDLICANLPYIPTKTLHNLDVFQREPTLALDGGRDGLDLIKKLLKQAQTQLTPGGLILLEIDASHRKSAAKAARQIFPDAQVSVQEDLAGHARLLVVQT